MSATLLGAALGAVFGCGLVIVGRRLLASRRPTLESRVAPYVRDVPTVAPTWQHVVPSDRPSSALIALARPLLESGADRLERILGGRESINRRLRRAGSSMTVEEFRVSQVLWGLAAFAFVLVIGLAGPARDASRALPWLGICAGAAVLGVLMREGALTRAVRNREEQILAEFPVVADLLALAVAAGEGPVAALDRVVSTCRGALPDELGVVLAESRTGIPVARALDGFAQRSGLAVVSRFAEGFRGGDRAWYAARRRPQRSDRRRPGGRQTGADRNRCPKRSRHDGAGRVLDHACHVVVRILSRCCRTQPIGVVASLGGTK